jgi:hypothetical protein
LIDIRTNEKGIFVFGLRRLWIKYNISIKKDTTGKTTLTIPNIVAQHKNFLLKLFKEYSLMSYTELRYTVHQKFSLSYHIR